MKQAYAVLKGNSFARSWGVDPTDHDFPEGDQVFSFEEAQDIAGQYQTARIVEVHFCPTLFDLAEPQLIRHGNWLSNGFVLTRAFDLDVDQTRIPQLIKAIKSATLDRLERVAMCPPNALSQGFVMHVFAPQSLGSGPYRDRVASLVCVSERYLEQMHPNWEGGALYLTTSPNLVTHEHVASGIVALYSGDGQGTGDFNGACMPLATREKLTEVQQAVDWTRGGQDW